MENTDSQNTRRLAAAESALQAGNPVSAIFALKRVIRRQPAHYAARLLLADAHLLQGDVASAARLASELLAERPHDDSASQSARLADICLRCEFWFDALELYEPLVAARDDESLFYRAGTAAFKVGRLDAAEQYFGRAAELRPEVAASFLQLGHIARANRNFERAARCYFDYLQRADTARANGYWSLADLRDYRFDDAMMDEMRQYRAACAEGTAEAAITDFAIAIALEQTEDYDQALRFFRSANDALAVLRPFASTAFARLVDDLLGVTDISTDEAPAAAHRPIFVVGLPRSGTTLVEQILAAHSDVVATGELPYMERIALRLERSGGIRARLSAMTTAEREALRAEYLDSVIRHGIGSGGSFIDKNPNNFLHVGLIRRLFPEARIIDVRRDLRDSGLSIYRQFFAAGHDYSTSWDSIFTYSRAYLQLMRHWAGRLDDALRIQSYETLVTRPATEIPELLAFCGLPVEKGCLEFHASAQPVLTPSASQVSRPMYTTSIGRWRRYNETLYPAFERLEALQME